MSPVDPPVKPTSTDTAPDQALAKPSMKERLTRLVKEYGPVAILIHVTVAVLSFTGCVIAIRSGLDTPALGQRLGIELKSDGEKTGTFFGSFVGAYVLYKAIQVPRIFLTLVLTPVVGRIPFVARLIHRSRSKKK